MYEYVLVHTHTHTRTEEDGAIAASAAGYYRGIFESFTEPADGKEDPLGSRGTRGLDWSVVFSGEHVARAFGASPPGGTCGEDGLTAEAWTNALACHDWLAPALASVWNVRRDAIGTPCAHEHGALCDAHQQRNMQAIDVTKTWFPARNGMQHAHATMPDTPPAQNHMPGTTDVVCALVAPCPECAMQRMRAGRPSTPRGHAGQAARSTPDADPRTQTDGRQERNDVDSEQIGPDAGGARAEPAEADIGATHGEAHRLRRAEEVIELRKPERLAEGASEVLELGKPEQCAGDGREDPWSTAVVKLLAPPCTI